MDYAMKKGISLSTLRRHIKANKIVYKVEGGRYLLFDDSDDFTPAAPRQDRDEVASIVTLEQQLQQAQEEIAELKTLIAFYEERSSSQRLDV